ncbi:hypothetical protein BT63DRAFT_449250 [Microthyrium microscopicum]|uniref:Uncharacterized protein n=1 Tax=Microthyrium microscopicum TaxID=703497 RepID=A0A6A6UT71_9PEZI|nr:hypothetical protein BT63DRAFT_449250 [Microthyrium microscopicum]
MPVEEKKQRSPNVAEQWPLPPMPTEADHRPLMFTVVVYAPSDRMQEMNWAFHVHDQQIEHHSLHGLAARIGSFEDLGSRGDPALSRRYRTSVYVGVTDRQNYGLLQEALYEVQCCFRTGHRSWNDRQYVVQLMMLLGEKGILETDDEDYQRAMALLLSRI